MGRSSYILIKGETWLNKFTWFGFLFRFQGQIVDNDLLTNIHNYLLSTYVMAGTLLRLWDLRQLCPHRLE